ncbi:MAG: hypothetical protein II820_10865 [Ruminiclostridium sp.]|nr:hypothetical protein [Ruminiclostridium sp.]
MTSKGGKNDAGNEVRRSVSRRAVVILVISAVLLLTCVYFLANTMLGFTAYSRYDALCAKAGCVYDAAAHIIETGGMKRMSTQVQCTGSRNGIDEHITKCQFLERDDYGKWYAIVCDDNGELLYTLFSESRIDINNIGLPDKNEQISRLGNLFLQGTAVGFFTGQQDISGEH